LSHDKTGQTPEEKLHTSKVADQHCMQLFIYYLFFTNDYAGYLTSI
jgi:hypothetical protein